MFLFIISKHSNFSSMKYNISLPSGGIGEAVLSALALERSVVVQHLFVKEVPRSGPPQALLDKYGISAKHIVAAANKLLTV